MGSSLPTVELARWDSGVFVEIKCFFSIAPVKNLEKSRECFSLEKHSLKLATEASDASSVEEKCMSERLRVSVGRNIRTIPTSGEV